MTMLGAVAQNATVATIGVGFGTAALGVSCHQVVLIALQAGFRKFDTAEEDQWWYNQKAVGTALQEFYSLFGKANESDNSYITDDECVMMMDEGGGEPTCAEKTTRTLQSCLDLCISTKIPPWELTSSDNIRTNAANSRQLLLGFCDDQQRQLRKDDKLETARGTLSVPLDVYYIHAPTCWKGWHTRCEDPPPLLDLRSAWKAMEAVVGTDKSAKRVGLSNVRPDELLDIIAFVRSRQAKTSANIGGEAPPRIPDVVQAFADPIQPAEELRKVCQEHGIEFVSYSTLGTQHRSGSNPVLGSTIVQSLASKYGRSTAEVVLSWALQHGMSVIPRSSQERHIYELARLLPEKMGGDAAHVGFLDPHDLSLMDLLKNTA